jgi:hypothetical protein
MALVQLSKSGEVLTVELQRVVLKKIAGVSQEVELWILVNFQ